MSGPDNYQCRARERCLMPEPARAAARRGASRRAHGPPAHSTERSSRRDTFTSDPSVKRRLEDQSISSWEMVAQRGGALMLQDNPPSSQPGCAQWHRVALGLPCQPLWLQACLKFALTPLTFPMEVHGGLDQLQGEETGLMLTVTGPSRPCRGPHI